MVMRQENYSHLSRTVYEVSEVNTNSVGCSLDLLYRGSFQLCQQQVKRKEEDKKRGGTEVAQQRRRVFMNDCVDDGVESVLRVLVDEDED